MQYGGSSYGGSSYVSSPYGASTYGSGPPSTTNSSNIGMQSYAPTSKPVMQSNIGTTQPSPNVVSGQTSNVPQSSVTDLFTWATSLFE
jgi:hypothetical protein